MANYSRATNPDDPWGRAEKRRTVDPELEATIRLIQSLAQPKSHPTSTGGTGPLGLGRSRGPGNPKPMGLGTASRASVGAIPLVERASSRAGLFNGSGSSSRFQELSSRLTEMLNAQSMNNPGDPRRGEAPRRPVPGNLGQGLAGMANAIRGIGDVARSNQAQGFAGVGASAVPSFDEIMGQIQASMSVPAPDAAGMAQKQFAPQFDLLSQLRSQTTGRMNQQADDAQAMYDALASSIEGDKSQVTQQYDTAAQNLDAAFSDASASIGATGDKSNADADAIMRRLGITAAAPDVQAAIAEDQQRSANAIAEMQANYAGNNEASRQSALDFITEQANNAGIAGANARADVETALANALAGYDNQELALKGQQQAAENEYAMQIAGMQSEQQSAAMDQAWRQYQAMMDQNRWQQEYDWQRQTDTWDNEIARAAQERALREMLQKGAEGSTSAAGKVDASTALMQEAAKYFPEDDQMANTVAQRIREALAANPDVETIAQLLQAVKARYPGNPRADLYTHLASLYGERLGLG